jgi:MFS superfamily sulfate permease-like transporter
MSILVGGAIPSTIAGGTVHACDTNPAQGLTEEETCPERIGLALLLAFIAGVFQLLMGTLRLGFLVDLVSEPVISGFTSGAAFLIAATQFSNSLGIQKCTKLKNVGTGMLYKANAFTQKSLNSPTSAGLDGFYVKDCLDPEAGAECKHPKWHEVAAMPDQGTPILKTEKWPT